MPSKYDTSDINYGPPYYTTNISAYTCMVTLVSAVAQILSGFCKWPGQTELSYVCLYCFTVLMLMLLHLIGATTLNRGHSYIDITTVSSDRSVHIVSSMHNLGHIRIYSVWVIMTPRILVMDLPTVLRTSISLVHIRTCTVKLVSDVAQILSGFCKWSGQTELSCHWCKFTNRPRSHVYLFVKSFVHMQ